MNGQEHDWLRTDEFQAVSAAPKSPAWLNDSAYFRFLDRQRNGIPGNERDDWEYAQNAMDIRIERIFLDEHMKKCVDPKEKIRYGVLMFVSVFNDCKPSDVSDDMPLEDCSFFDDGLDLAVSCMSIGDLAEVGELEAPEGVRTIGELVAALQKAYRPPQAKEPS
jgi:hypothetical protein